jgi:acid phosphatase
VTADNIYITAPDNREVTYSQVSDKFCTRNITKQYRNFTAYLNRFGIPGDESKGYKNLWDSFDYGLAYFMIINTETDFSGAPADPHNKLNGGNFAPNGTQLKRLKADLQVTNANRKKFPWIIVSGHRPFYGSLLKYRSGWGHNDNCNECRNAFAEVIFNNSVDFYFCSHVHWYDRRYPFNHTSGRGRRSSMRSARPRLQAILYLI